MNIKVWILWLFAQLLLQDMNTMVFGCILAYMTVFTVVEINTKSILIKNSTVKNIISENHPSNRTLTSTLMDQLYKETMLRFQIEKKVQALTDKVSNLEKREVGFINTKPKGKGKEKETEKTGLVFNVVIFNTRLSIWNLVAYNGGIEQYGCSTAGFKQVLPKLNFWIMYLKTCSAM